MTPREFLEFQLSLYERYLEQHNHDNSCKDCHYARVQVKVATSMLRDNDFPDDTFKCMEVYYDNALFTLEQEQQEHSKGT